VFNEVVKVLLFGQVSQIILVAYIGALLGEMRKEFDDNREVVLAEFLVSWLGSGFGGAMVGLMLKGSIVKEAEHFYFVIGATGVTGYAGYKKSIGLALGVLNKLAKEDKEKDE
jgi:hypothetical protein